MTGPAGGHPDWQDATSWRGALVYNELISPGALTTTIIGPWNITNYASLRINAELLAGGAGFDLQTSDDPTFATFEAHKGWSLAATTTMVVIVPSLGNYARMVISTPAANGVTVRLKIQPVNTATENVRYIGSAIHVVQFNTVLAAGASQTTFFNRITPGPAFISIDMATAPPTLLFRFRRIMTDGTALNRIAQWANIPGVTQEIIHLPETPFDFVVTNTGGANQQFSLSIATGVGTF